METLKCLLRSTTSQWVVAVLGVLALVLPGVSALNDRIPVIASSAVALFMLLILIVVIVFASCFAQTWIRSSMRHDGKVKMPRSYFEKKMEAKKRVAAESLRSSRLTQDTYVSRPPSPMKPAPVLVNGASPPGMPPMDKVEKRETLVQGWNQNTKRIYEEKAYTLELGDENEEEFHIETTIVDNEVLDVGPYTNLGSTGAKPVDGNVYANTYLYTNNDRVTVTRSSENTAGIVSSAGSPSTIGEYSNVIGHSAAGGFDDKVIKL